MRLAAFFVVVCLLAPSAQLPSPFLPVAVEYDPERGASRRGIESDLQVIRSLHYNSIRFTLRWSEAEPVPGTLALEPLEGVLEAAARSGLRVILRIDLNAPEWVFTRYADAQRRTSDGPSPRAACGDHPGVRADMSRFVASAARAAAGFHSLLAIDAGSDPPTGLCLCPYTRRRIDAEGGADRSSAASVVRSFLRADLAALVSRVREGATSAVLVTSHAGLPSALRSIDGGAPGQDDGLMRSAVDQYGTTIDAKSSSPPRLPLALDAISDRGATPGWSLDLDASVPERDRRLVTWAAMSRGARALIYENPPEPAVAATIARNTALFSQLVPRRGAGSDVRIEGGDGIEVRMLESDTVQMIVGLNYGAESRRVTMTFPPGTQEAIWQNMETGAGVNFIAGADGPSYTYWFRPKDALVLMIRKDIR